MASKLPYVQTRKRADGTLAHRGYADTRDGREFSATYDSEHDAYLAALRMRKMVVDGGTGETLDDAGEVFPQ